MNLYRTSDRSNETLRFNRTMKDAGLLGPLSRQPDDSPWKWLAQFAGATLAGVGIYGLLWAVFSLVKVM